MNTHAEHITRFERGPALLREVLEGITADELSATPGPGKWSPLELVIHIQDSDAIAIDRMKRVIAEENPTLLGADESAYVQRLHCSEQTLSDALTLIEVGRRQFAQVLRQLSDDDFSRQGTHNDAGPLSVLDLLNIYTEHLEYHLDFLERKLQQLRR